LSNHVNLLSVRLFIERFYTDNW